MKLEGKVVWKFGDNVDTDLIIPARFLNVSDKDELARNCFADLKPDIRNTINPGDVIVAGKNFGCGSSREHAPLAIKSAGIAVIIAKSFARIFYRNAFNIGLPILESKEASLSTMEGNRVSVDLATGEIVILDTGQRFFARPVPDFMREILKAGGLVEYIKRKRLIEQEI
ncbi:MAG: 3-isopropylmalate dehydratase small subunit [Deltaproteobacteria bacterium]|jgi:3-isopropylmalate/(R)-2-methylmalate dehydratase small subunit|nr:MAG: 3-isopropylmalate dehydratase small subunit [Deltaproteobacteria bacterium]